MPCRWALTFLCTSFAQEEGQSHHEAGSAELRRGRLRPCEAFTAEVRSFSGHTLWDVEEALKKNKGSLAVLGRLSS